MKFGNFIIFFLFSIREISFYLVRGQTNNKEKSDCTKLYNIINRDSKNYFNSCCEDDGIECDNEGYITYFNA